MKERKSTYNDSINAISCATTLRNLALAALVGFVSIGSAEAASRIDNNGTTMGTVSDTFNDVYSGVATNGGAISNFNGSTIDKIENSTFINNDVNSAGGAIFNQQNSKITSIVNSTFESNKVEGSGETFGGAIFNKGNSSIDSITGSFISNSTSTSSGNQSQGGAIFNDWNGSIGNIGTSSTNSTFSGNYAYSAAGIANGGAINNGWGATIGTIYADFSGNYASAATTAFGGAISNYAGRNNVNIPSTIAGINGDFISNYATSTGGDVIGGAIYNGLNPATSQYPSVITNGITGNFSGNYAKTTSGVSKGGAIANVGSGSKLNKVTGDFSGNYAEGTSAAKGGAIYNDAGSIENGINGNFTENYAKATSGTAYGGAIYNVSDANLSSITSTGIGFSKNYAEGSSEAYGGAIYNDGGSIANGIKADFTENYATGSGTTQGGAIWNTGVLGNIEGDFSKNYAEGSGWVEGGAIWNRYNSGVITSITGDFVENYIKGSSGTMQGGAIYNNASSIGAINGNFVKNEAIATSGTVNGGAIFNTGATIGTITGDFEANKAISSSGSVKGGAIYNVGGSTIDSVVAAGDGFKDNSANATNGDAFGGAIYNDANITNSISANFSNNKATSNCSSWGGAIYNKGTIGAINGSFSNNVATADGSYAYGGAILNDGNGSIASITGDFVSNSVKAKNAKGGAIYNAKSPFAGNAAPIIAGKIDGDFSNNFAEATNGSAYGGAIYNDNEATIDSIEGNFSGNYTKSTSDSMGGAIYNSGGNIGKIEGKFENNSAEGYNARGGAVVQKSFTIAGIQGSFTGNTVTSSNGAAEGGAIYNTATITGIDGDFSQNIAKATGSGIVRGGAIYNSGTISGVNNANAIIGNFDANQAIANTSDAYGGAIYNTATIKGIEGNFSNNLATTTTGWYTQGGAIFNTGTIDGVKGNFTNNETSSVRQSFGGAVYNNGDAADITSGIKGNFENNSVTATGDAASLGFEVQAHGGAIYNHYGATIGTIDGKFVGSTATAEDGMARGGAIYSNGGQGLITKITAIVNSEFSNNTVKGGTWAEGGAIFNDAYSEIGDITANFTNNSVTATIEHGKGGAINNSWYSDIDDIKGNFTNNSVTGVTVGAGGALVNNTNSSIASIEGSFVGNSVYTDGANVTPEDSHSASAGALLNSQSTIGNITGDFLNNSATAKTQSAFGGAIVNTSKATIQDITGRFSGNAVTGELASSGGAIMNYANSSIGNIVGDFDNNTVKSVSNSANGGAIANNNNSSIKNITGIFLANTVEAGTVANGGALFNNLQSSVLDIAGDFLQNSVTATEAANGGAIFNNMNSSIGNIVGDFVQNTAISDGAANGGAIYNNSASSIGNVTGVFAYNSAVGVTSANGGAIYNNKATIGAKDSDGKVIGGLINSSLIGNSAIATSGQAKGGAIYTTSDLALYNDGVNLEIRDNYTESYGVKDDNAIYVDSADATLTINLKNNANLLLQDNIDGVTGYNVNIIGDGSNIVSLNNEIRNADVAIGGFTLNSYDNQVNIHEFNSLTLADNVTMGVDIDLAKGVMDSFRANSFAANPNAVLNINALNRLSDMREDQDIVDIYFVGAGMKDNVKVDIPEQNADGLISYVTPVYKYNAIYDKGRDDAGYFVFSKGNIIPIQGGGSITNGNASAAFNPAVLGGATSSTVGALTTMNQSLNYAFQYADNFMNIPYMERVAIRDRNKLAIAPVDGARADVQTFSPLLSRQETSSVWVRPYATFESIPLRNGPKVSNITYGTLIGFDTDIESCKNGWDRVFTGYIGYNGASQRYSGVDSYQNGGMLGGTMTLYKGNFFNATTVSSGALVASNTNMYGSEDFAMLTAGVGNKFGYNFEFKEGKIILQPSMLMSYSFVNTFDYTSASGVRIDNKPLHAIQLIPGLKLIGNTKNGWQPYAGVSMVWNVMGKSDSYANGIHLPSMSLKPYVQYGIGVQKRIKDSFMAYGQAMILNGGRNGVSLAAGFRWAVGKEGAPIQKVQHNAPKVVKQLSVSIEQPQVAVESTAKPVKNLKSVIKAVEIDKKGEVKQMEFIVKVDAYGRKVIKEMSPAQKMINKSQNSQISKAGKYSTIKQI